MAEINIRIDWSELDLYGHVNNVMIFKYIQGARISYCEKIGLGTLNEPGKPGFIVAASNVLYKRKILYPGQLRVESHVQWIKNTSFQLDHVIYNEHNERLVEGYDIIVGYDYEKDSKTAITDDLRLSIEKLENKTPGSLSKDPDLAQYPDIE
jgi:acyl-CoA thioester hydrolase